MPDGSIQRTHEKLDVRKPRQPVTHDDGSARQRERKLLLLQGVHYILIATVELGSPQPAVDREVFAETGNKILSGPGP